MPARPAAEGWCKDLQLLEAARHGDPQARVLLFLAARPLVKSRVTKIVRSIGPHHLSSRGLAVSDLMQEGYIGVLLALQSFDPNHPSQASFLTHATWRIDSAVRNALRDNSPGGLRPHVSRVEALPPVYALDNVPGGI